MKIPSFGGHVVRSLAGLLVLGVAVWASAAFAEPESGKGAAAAPAETAVPAETAAPAEASADRGVVTKGDSEEPAPSADGRNEDSPSLVRTAELTRLLNDFVDGRLAVDKEPDDLFDIDLNDATAVEVERMRLETLAAGSPQAAAVPHQAEGEESKQKPVVGAPTPSAEEPSQGKSEHDEAEEHAPVPSLWEARRALDAARLAFLTRPAEERHRLLAQHEARQEEARATVTEKQLNEVDAEAALAEREKAAAIEAARTARSEAVRAVHEEYARLLDVTKLQAEFEKELIQSQADATQRYDDALKLQREVSEKIAKREISFGNIDPLDEEYVRLRTRLREARGLEAQSLNRLSRRGSRVPTAEKDALAELPADVDRSKVDKARAHIDVQTLELSAREEEVERERARLLMTEVEMLNRLRLALLPFLTSSKRADVTGFTKTGLDQARSEMTQVILTLRYHFEATRFWVRDIRSGTRRGESAWTASLLALKWLLPIGLFVWWRRRADMLLGRWADLVAANDREERGSSAQPSWLLLTVRFLRRVHRPLEWLLFLWSVLYLLPDSMRGLLEVELFSTVLFWTFGGSLVVMSIDALSSAELRGPRRASEASLTAHLRLRSLRLAGHTVVVFGLVLALSSELVGKGTIYRWVFSTCWFVAIPVLLVIIAWWKPTIFERIEVLRRKSATQRWVLAQRTGPMSFIAAIAGGVELFGAGAARTLRGWAVTFTVVRRLLAYLFRRGMSKKGSTQEVGRMPLPQQVYATIGPEQPSNEIVPSEADAQVDDVISRIQAVGGGVYAVIGERGRGKTTILERIASSDERISVVTCGVGGMAAFQRALNLALSLDENSPFEMAAKKLEEGGSESAILIDDAQRLILPMMEGLQEFDKVLELARETSRRCTWIFAIDESLWRFLERARGARPLFDDAIFLSPWSEEAIVRLLQHRNDLAGIQPNFSSLLPELPADADEIDVKEALEQTEENYYRLLWDYASGNPGVALHCWRNSLELDPEGRVAVRVFRAPEADDLEGLPDSTVFVLRAAVQLGYATMEHVCAATALPRSQVKDALRYGAAKGYFLHTDDTYFITWDWFRAITRFLKRRHLLFGS